MSIDLNNYGKFRQDIQGRDTSLIPIVKIGDIYISTNSMTYDNKVILPLLTSNPSLKESIDIEKRNYKISNISITVNNYPYEGKRFSDRVGSSLINEPVEVYWTSPQTNTFDFTQGNDSAIKIYEGQVRRYDHDDSSCKITAEDRSQATLHKDLPSEENYLTGTGVPDKYKNKPIPMVYGHVDRSPCVFKVETNPDIPEYSALKDIIADSQPVSFVDERVSLPQHGYLDIYGGLFIGDSSLGYAPCAREFRYNLTTDLFYFDLPYIDESNQNYSYDGLNATINLIDDSNNDVKRGILRGIIARSPADVTINTNVSPYNGYVAIENSNTIGYAALGVGSNWQPNDIENASPEALLRIINNNIDQGLHLQATVTPDISDYHGVKIELSPTNCGFDADSYFIGAYFSDYGTQTSGDFKNYPNVWAWINYEVLYWAPTLGGWLDNIQGWFSNTSLGDAGNQSSPFTKKLTHVGVPSSIIDFNIGVTNYQTDPGGSSPELPVHIDVWAANIFHVTYVDKLVDRDFYANVKGRAMSGNDYPNALTVIKHILEYELGQPVSGVHNYGWKYAFTLDKKINSKKLIEGIASASQYIPRFDNMGNFRFDIIHMDAVSVADDHIIKEEEVIDFSFSRTKIEDVYTKIVFKYNWDYARGEFNDSVIADISLLGSTADNGYNYDFGYYGFDTPDDTVVDDDLNLIHPQSTLVIDDDRGKYIRAKNTAHGFADWYLLWSCNQHLKMKVKLPLKYMGFEIGDMVKFKDLLGDIEPYGINYVNIDDVNAQTVFKNFLITSTNKTLEWVEIECIQMHNLNSGNIYGCTNDTACNYNSIANTDNGNCDYGKTYCYDHDNDGTGSTLLGTEKYCSPAEALADNYVSECEDCDAGFDCNDVCNGTAVIDECGVCGGGNADDLGCGCFEPAPSGCDDACGSILEFDECGVCDGDGWDCFDCDVGTGLSVELWGTNYPISTTTEINLNGLSLSGGIDPNIGCLIGLESLTIYNCQLSGTIPASIGNLTSLHTLSLHNNELTGEIPSEIGQLTNLTKLNLYYNELTGEIPSEIGNMTNLTRLRLYNNQLTGEIPPEIGNLTNLESLTLSNNQLIGEIPLEIGNLTNLGNLSLDNNQLSGIITPLICNWAVSYQTYISGNQFCPPYPECISDSHIGEQDTTDCFECTIGDMNNDGRCDEDDVGILSACWVGSYCHLDPLLACAGDINGDGIYNELDIILLSNCVNAGGGACWCQGLGE